MVSFTPWWIRRSPRLPSREGIPLSFDEIGECGPTNISAFNEHERPVLTQVLEEWYGLDDN